MKNQTSDDLRKIIELQHAVAMGNLELYDLMDLICVKTQDLTQASGAVVEMAEGDDMVYRASSGTLAKSIGLRLKRATSLSGMSVEKGEVLYCVDSETDPRVDREACQRVGARSMICVPLLYENHAVGVLKVVSPKPEKFSERETGLLKLCANLLSASISQAKYHQLILDSERKFRTLIETASDAILISKDGVSLEANASFSKLFGYSPEEIQNKKTSDYIDPKFQQETLQRVAKAYSEPYESVAITKDGATFDVEILGRTLEINGERIRVTNIRDISKQKRIEESMRESEKQSREAALAKASFMANMSHEIRTPLNGILGMTGLLMETQLDSQQRQYLNIIKSSGNSLLSIVNDILDFSKIEAKKLILEEISFELGPAIEDVRHVLSYSAKDKNLNLTIQSETGIPSFVKGDPTRLRQVLMNLISNAIKFTHQGSVTLDVHYQDGLARFSIIDTGIGIPEEALTGMFQPFTQVDSSTTRKFGGTGLGLSICRELVSAMKGRIGVTSSYQRGSTFWFEIPLPEDKSERVKIPTDRDKTLRSRRKLRILIAEDNAVNALIAKKMAEKLGHTVTQVGNGKEALEAITLAPYDLVLMDCQMPEMDGFEATKFIRAHEKSDEHLKIIAMTAHAMTGDRERCLTAGMDDYVSKPMKIEDLHAALERLEFSDE